MSNSTVIAERVMSTTFVSSGARTARNKLPPIASRCAFSEKLTRGNRPNGAALRRIEEEVLKDHVSRCVEHAIASGDKSDHRKKIGGEWSKQ